MRDVLHMYISLQICRPAGTEGVVLSGAIVVG